MLSYAKGSLRYSLQLGSPTGIRAVRGSRSRVTIGQLTVNVVRSIIEIDNLPRGRINNCLLDMKTGIRMQVTQAKRDFIEQAKFKGLATPEVKSLARRLVREGDTRSIKQEEKRQMKMPLLSKLDLNRAKKWTRQA